MPKLKEVFNSFYESGLDLVLKENPERRKENLIFKEICCQNKPTSYYAGPALLSLQDFRNRFRPGEQDDSSDALSLLIGNVFPDEIQNLFNFKTNRITKCYCGNVRLKN